MFNIVASEVAKYAINNGMEITVDRLTSWVTMYIVHKGADVLGFVKVKDYFILACGGKSEFIDLVFAANNEAADMEESWQMHCYEMEADY